jgi:ABC-2 type transport system permease protein
LNIKGIIKKEILEGIRNYRFLIIFGGLLFFAILDPIMNKIVMPQLLKSQFPNMTLEAINDMLASNQISVIRGYLEDIFEIGTIIITFTLSGIVAQEISEKTLILPITTGKRYGHLIIGKVLVYGSILIFATTTSAIVNYIYSGVLYDFELFSLVPLLRAGLLQGLYMIFVLSIIILIGSFVRKTISTGLLTLIIAYGTTFLGSLFEINNYLPAGLLSEGKLLAVIPSLGMFKSILCTISIIIISMIVAVIRLSNMELTRG